MSAASASDIERDKKIAFFSLLATKAKAPLLNHDLLYLISSHLDYYSLCRLRLTCRYFAGLHSWYQWQDTKIAFLRKMGYSVPIIARLFSNALLLRYHERRFVSKFDHAPNYKVRFHRWHNQLTPINYDIPLLRDYLQRASLLFDGNYFILSKIHNFLQTVGIKRLSEPPYYQLYVLFSQTNYLPPSERIPFKPLSEHQFFCDYRFAIALLERDPAKFLRATFFTVTNQPTTETTALALKHYLEKLSVAHPAPSDCCLSRILFSNPLLLSLKEMPRTLIENDLDLDPVLVKAWLETTWPSILITGPWNSFHSKPKILEQQKYEAYPVYHATIWYLPGCLPEFFRSYNSLPTTQALMRAQTKN